MKRTTWRKRDSLVAGLYLIVLILGFLCYNEVSAQKRDAEPEKETEVIQTTMVQTEETEAAGVTFTDDLGREITVDNPERVVTLLGSFTDIWLLSGGEVVATVKDSWSNFDLNLPDDVINLGSHLELDIEQLIAAEPDLVLASSNLDAHRELESVLTQAGITVAYFDVSNFDEYLHMLDICTRITGDEEPYQTYGVDVQKEIEEQKKRADGSAPTVLFLRASSTNVKAKGSDGCVGSEILADLGCVNIADSDESLLEDLSMEAIIAADPDYIFVTNQGNTEEAMNSLEEFLTSNPAWNALTAVKENRYYVIDKNLYNTKPNARWGEAYKQLADILYPQAN